MSCNYIRRLSVRSERRRCSGEVVQVFHHANITCLALASHYEVQHQSPIEAVVSSARGGKGGAMHLERYPPPVNLLLFEWVYPSRYPVPPYLTTHR